MSVKPLKNYLLNLYHDQQVNLASVSHKSNNLKTLITEAMSLVNSIISLYCKVMLKIKELCYRYHSKITYLINLYEHTDITSI